MHLPSEFLLVATGLFLIIRNMSNKLKTWRSTSGSKSLEKHYSAEAADMQLLCIHCLANDSATSPFMFERKALLTTIYRQADPVCTCAHVGPANEGALKKRQNNHLIRSSKLSNYFCIYAVQKLSCGKFWLLAYQWVLVEHHSKKKKKKATN